MSLLYIDACVRADSRTRELAKTIIEQIGEPVEYLFLSDRVISPLDEECLQWRTQCCQRKCFDDSYFDYARQLAGAEDILIAAPYWDLSFPAVLKKYFEAVSICGLSFAYSEQGIPIGLCRGKRFFYVTTAGGPILNPDYGYGYAAGLMELFGIREHHCFKAENLDLVGADEVSILSQAKKEIIDFFSSKMKKE